METGSIEQISSKTAELDRQRSADLAKPPDDEDVRSRWFYTLIVSNFMVVIGIAWTINNYKEGHNFGDRGSLINWIALLLPYVILLIFVWMVIGRRLAEGESGRLILVTAFFVLIAIFTKIIPLGEFQEFIAYSANDTTSNITTTPTILNGTGLDPTNDSSSNPIADIDLGKDVATLEEAINKWFMIFGPLIIFAALLLFYYSIKKEGKTSVSLYSELQDEDDLPHKALSERNLDVVKLYSSTRTKLATEGAKDTLATTPTEFATKAVEDIPVDENLSELTDVFELARFSEHSVTKEELKNARSYVENIEKEIAKKATKEPDDLTGDDSHG